MHDELVARLRDRARREDEYYAHGGDVINEAADAIEELTDRNVGKWINYLEDGFVECPFCHSATNYGDISELHYCFNCGAKLDGDDDV